MLDHVFTDAIGALRDALESALLERQAFEERFSADVLLGDLTWATSYSLPGEGLPPRVQADLTLSWPTWAQTAWRTWYAGEMFDERLASKSRWWCGSSVWLSRPICPGCWPSSRFAARRWVSITWSGRPPRWRRFTPCPEVDPAVDPAAGPMAHQVAGRRPAVLATTAVTSRSSSDPRSTPLSVVRARLRVEATLADGSLLDKHFGAMGGWISSTLVAVGDLTWDFLPPVGDLPFDHDD